MITDGDEANVLKRLSQVGDELLFRLFVTCTKIFQVQGWDLVVQYFFHVTVRNYGCKLKKITQKQFTAAKTNRLYPCPCCSLIENTAVIVCLVNVDEDILSRLKKPFFQHPGLFFIERGTLNLVIVVFQRCLMGWNSGFVI